MLVRLLLVVARRDRGRWLLLAIAELVDVASIDDALSLEIDEAVAAGRVQTPALIEPRVVTALLRLLAFVEMHTDNLPNRLVEAAADARAVAEEWGVPGGIVP